MIRNRNILLLVIFSTLLIGINSADAETQDITFLTFGIVPQQSATRLAKQWTPLIQYLNKKTGAKIIFKTAPDIPTFEQRLKQGEYDIAYMNPYHYTVFHEDPGYEAIAKEKDKKIQGFIIVAKDSPVTSIQQLNDEKLAFPAPAAFAASVLPRFSLARENIIIHPVYVSSHDSVYLSVSKGIFIAGGGIVRTLNAMPPDIQNTLRILWQTKKFTPHAIAIHPNFPEEMRNKISEALFSVSETENGRKILQDLNMKAFAAAENSDWDDVRDLGIKLLDTSLEKSSN
ncbi:phosphate/phosphite/phosphonate ABC transporter substrate-binding protein [Desulfosediminicola flagellatus]|uniref:phosphate/phosphite/phosphonate ABC transporter substrate-binding protein n=1 Tax=Desulfosediminicola flagellatus TaxID=2569541 RepID=UPI0010ABAF7C|nr:phosphate/phosphite/phosphonate ABC transporter substrate-binding protein [Desulfosediminicola flagellatus]